ncbi:hypothetical protein CDD80_774 [Ophiocordyceps camponoti-rufipedis]|uniref:Uncharacterized protein n=1 Tax=Ophiocordyceps camponoti-rufipedis TaxID=2004952 RepID=A0A2C5ZCT8_9HYPO|nr:hypothetical protein CDD80_774 [Ophiocordyceps camponoti-rufipedis]
MVQHAITGAAPPPLSHKQVQALTIKGVSHAIDEYKSSTTVASPPKVNSPPQPKIPTANKYKSLSPSWSTATTVVKAVKTKCLTKIPIPAATQPSQPQSSQPPPSQKTPPPPAGHPPGRGDEPVTAGSGRVSVGWLVGFLVVVLAF